MALPIVPFGTTHAQWALGVSRIRPWTKPRLRKKKIRNLFNGLFN
jgi:hypothetical protein